MGLMITVSQALTTVRGAYRIRFFNLYEPDGKRCILDYVLNLHQPPGTPSP